MQIETFKDYIEFTRTTAVYPKDRELDYLIFGLVDEAGELLEKVENKDDTKNIIGEMSDTCWYVARLFDYFDIEINEDPINSTSFEVLDINYVGEVISDNYTDKLLKDLVIRSTKICGYNKKYIRDNNEDKLEYIKRELKMISNRLELLATQLGAYNLRNVLQINVDKLSDRKERGVLKGDGDNR